MIFFNRFFNLEANQIINGMIRAFWDSYFSLLTSSDDKLKVTTWAATVGTITFLITFIIRPLVTKLKRKKNLLNVELGMSYQLVQTILGTNSDWPIVHCKITNTGEKALYIKQPILKLSRSINGEDKFSLVTQRGTYPRRIESGELIAIDYKTSTLYRDFLIKSPKDTTLSFIVSTTEPKEYFSNNSYTFEEILMHIDVSNNVK